MSDQTAKLISRLAENLPSMSKETMQYWIEHPKELGLAVAGVLSPKPELKVWKTIRLGVGPQNAKDLYAAIESARMKTRLCGRQFWPNFNVITGHKADIDLVLVRVAELGLRPMLYGDQGTYHIEPNSSGMKNIFQQARRLGLEPCSSEVGPRLRLQYGEQHNGERIFVGMKAIPITDGDPPLEGLFIVECDDNVLYISTHYVEMSYDNDTLFAFVLPRHK